MSKPATLCYTNINLCALRVAMVMGFVTLSACGGGGGGGDGGTLSSAAPIATSSAVSTTEDTPTGGTMIASDPNGDPLTYSIVTQPSMGSTVVTDASAGAFTYTPDADQNGTDTFSFKVSDGSFDSNTATVTVTIAADNDAPVADEGTLSTSEDTPGNSILTANDPDGDPLTYSIESQPSLGSAVITDATSGAYTYTPDPDQNGTDSFTFSANDGTTDSNIATVTVTINAGNDPPVAVGGCSTTPQAQTLTGTLSATDLETPTLLMFSLNADGSGGTGPIITAKSGTVTITDPTTGAFTYQPDSSVGDKRGVDSFDFQVSDTDGKVSSATEIVIVDRKIMPLGDSITLGSVFNGVDFGSAQERVGYRKPLFDALGAAGYTFDFVGSLSDGSAILSDFQHEGHGGYSAFDVAFGRDPNTEGVFNWLDANPADIVLLHAGTNDLANTTADDTADILNEIDRWENSAGGNPVTVILARIIDQNPFNGTVTPFNNSVEAMATSRILAGDDIIMVDQETGAGLIYTIDATGVNGDMSDDVHPTDNGYDKMEDVWFDALSDVNPNTSEAVLDKCP